MAQQSRALAALPEDLSSVLASHVRQLSAICDSSCKEAVALFRHSGHCMHVPPTQLKIKIFNKNVIGINNGHDRFHPTIVCDRFQLCDKDVNLCQCQSPLKSFCTSHTTTLGHRVPTHELLGSTFKPCCYFTCNRILFEFILL